MWGGVGVGARGRSPCKRVGGAGTPPRALSVQILWPLKGMIPPASTIRFQSNGDEYPRIVFGQPLAGVRVACSFGKVVAELSLVDVDGIECISPSEVSNWKTHPKSNNNNILI